MSIFPGGGAGQIGRYNKKHQPVSAKATGVSAGLAVLPLAEAGGPEDVLQQAGPGHGAHAAGDRGEEARDGLYRRESPSSPGNPYRLLTAWLLMTGITLAPVRTDTNSISSQEPRNTSHLYA